MLFLSKQFFSLQKSANLSLSLRTFVIQDSLKFAYFDDEKKTTAPCGNHVLFTNKYRK